MTGYRSFISRRLQTADWLLQKFKPGVLNRYAAWCQIAGVRYHELTETYRTTRENSWKKRSAIAIHVGAQWRSKQYPEVRRLQIALESAGHTVELWAGPQDRLPNDLKETDIQRLNAESLITGLDRIGLAIVNDSGPMHLSALLGAPTLAIGLTSNLNEWIPPHANMIAAPKMPTGYYPHRHYKTETILSGWPPASEIMKAAATILTDKRSTSQ